MHQCVSYTYIYMSFLIHTNSIPRLDLFFLKNKKKFFTMRLFNTTFFTTFVIILVGFTLFLEVDAFSPQKLLKCINKERAKYRLKPLTLNSQVFFISILFL